MTRKTISAPARGMAVITAAIAAMLLFLAAVARPSARAIAAPAPSVDLMVRSAATLDTAVLSGGCFWGVQAVFEHVKGVTGVTAGYAGGPASAAYYERVSTGTTGHAESVRIVYDPAKVTYGQLLRVFFSVAHDPTELDRQGPDVGPQYRSVIWYTTPEQQRIATAYIAQLGAAKYFPKPIVTRVEAFHGFYPAEAYHQDYLIHHPDVPYIVINDKPKLEHFRRALPELWQNTPVVYAADEAAR
ncbi:MAG TPA: peptide-methionine (S)-S-oxide reductase MsrA [Gemmatimonadaceae bacterium]|nr:peptide-methionine (S)-S-oxide reductase MsrA [Gemmatimonadaceae bacterium]